MTPIRKEFLKRLAYVALAIISIVIVWEENGPKRFIGIAGFIFGMYHLVMIIAGAQQIIDDFFPLKADKKLPSKPFDKFVYRFASVFFFAGLVFELFEIRRIDNTIRGMSLFWNYALIGILIAILVIAMLKFKSPSIFSDSSRRFVIHFGLVLGFFLFTPAGASCINHRFVETTIDCNEYKIVRKSTGGRRKKASWIFVQISGHVERFSVSRDFWNGLKEGGPVVLCTQKGRLGYDFVREFKNADQ